MQDALDRLSTWFAVDADWNTLFERAAPIIIPAVFLSTIPLFLLIVYIRNRAKARALAREAERLGLRFALHGRVDAPYPWGILSPDKKHHEHRVFDGAFEGQQVYAFETWARRRQGSRHFLGTYGGDAPLVMFYKRERWQDTNYWRRWEQGGLQRVDLHPGKFADAYTVVSTDPEFARALCTEELTAYLVEHRDVNMTLLGNRLLLNQDGPLRPKNVEPGLRQLVALQRLLPVMAEARVGGDLAGTGAEFAEKTVAVEPAQEAEAPEAVSGPPVASRTRGRGMPLSAWALLGANAVPLLLAVAGRLEADTLLLLYWRECWVIGAFTLLKIATSQAPLALGGSSDLGRLSARARRSVAEATPEINPAGAKVGAGCSFVFVYGMACVFLGFVTVGIVASGNAAGTRIDLSGPRLLLWMFIASHGLSYYLNYVKAEERRRAQVKDLFFDAFGRIVVMMGATMIVGGVALALFDTWYAAAAVAAIKTVFDFRGHQRQRARYAAGASGGTSSPRDQSVASE